MSRNIFYAGSFENQFYICSLDTNLEKPEYLSCVEHLKPVHMTTSKDGKKLFIASENSGGNGQVASYDITDPLEPKLISAVSCPAEGPCYIRLSNDEAFLIGAGYFEGNLAVYPVQSDGKIGEKCFEYQSKETGTAFAIGTFGQDVPRMHCVAFVKDTDYVLAADYSGDRIINFEIDEKGCLHEKTVLYFPKGDAPRQFAASPVKDNIFYVVTEISSRVYVVKVEPDTGEMEILDSISTLPDGRKSWSASIRVSPDGKFLYVSNRTDKNISVIALESDYEKLAYFGVIEDVGSVRDAAPDPSGKFLVVAVENENLIKLYTRDQENGLCTIKTDKLQVQIPVCLAFVS